MYCPKGKRWNSGISGLFCDKKAGVILKLHSAIRAATVLPHPAPRVFLGTQQARARQAAISTAAWVDNLATAQNLIFVWIWDKIQMILNVYKDLSSNYYFRSNTIFQAFPKKQIGQTTGKNHMVVCIQKNWLGHKVLMQKMLVQTDHPSLT